MSRCFPFPPPGYEKEARTCDLDLLKKEKDKERKHKKEKRNREKKEGKDKGKKEKDRSEGRRRGSKEKKEKHRDKEEKNRDDNRLPKQVERICVDKALDGQKLQFPGTSDVNTGGLSSQKGKEKELDRHSLSGDKKTSRQFLRYGERTSQNSQSTDPPKDSKVLQQADWGIRDEARGAGKQSVEKLTGADARKDEGMGRLVAKSTGTSSGEKVKINTSEDGKLNEHGVKNGQKLIGNVASQSIPGLVHPRIDKTLKSLENEVDKGIERNEKSKRKELDDRQGDERRVKEVREKEKDRDKEKKKEKAKQRSQQKKTEPVKSKETGTDDASTDINVGKPSQISDEGIKNPATEGNAKKRKDLDSNGFWSGNEIKPSKVPKPSSLHPLTRNGKVSGTPSPVLLGRQGAVNKLQTDGKEHRINGIAEFPASAIPSTSLLPSIPTKPSITIVKVESLAEPSRKQPHPDSIYLSEVLTVPKMEEWCDDDDQKWLFQGNDSQSKKPKVGSFEVDEIPQVWSEALRLESADVCALPYVIPY